MPVLRSSDFLNSANVPTFHLSPSIFTQAQEKQFVLAGETGNDSLVIAIPNCQVSFALGTYGPFLKADSKRNTELIALIQDKLLAQLPEKLGVSSEKIMPLMKPVVVDPEDKINALFKSQQLFLTLRRKGCKLGSADGKEPDYQELVESKRTRKVLLFLHPESVVKKDDKYQLRLEVSQIFLMADTEVVEEKTITVAEPDTCDDPTQLL